MRKSVEICGRKVYFEFTIFSLVIYKREFFCELLNDLQEIMQTRIEWLFPEKATEHTETVYRILWALAKTADDNIPPPDDFLDSFDEFSVFDIFNEIYDDVIFSALKYDRKYRVEQKNHNGSNSSTEEMIAVFMNAGLQLCDLKSLTIGMGINLIRANADLNKIARGEYVPDREKQYRALKAQEKTVEERYKNGEITKQKYDSFKSALRQWEEA